MEPWTVWKPANMQLLMVSMTMDVTIRLPSGILQNNAAAPTKISNKIHYKTNYQKKKESQANPDGQVKRNQRAKLKFRY